MCCNKLCNVSSRNSVREVVREIWRLSKTYLRNLSGKGYPHPPTLMELISVPKNIADLANWGVPLDSIAVSLFGWSEQIQCKSSPRWQDPNNYSDTETRALFNQDFYVTIYILPEVSELFGKNLSNWHFNEKASSRLFSRELSAKCVVRCRR